MPIKRVGVLDNTSVDIEPAYGSLHLATSELFRFVVALSFAVEVEQVRLSALPRTDVLSRPHAMAPTRAEILRTLGMASDRRLVVWLPTFRTSSLSAALERGRHGPRCFLDDLSAETLAGIDAEAGRWGCTVLVKLHPYDPLNDRDPDDTFEHVRFLRSTEWLATGIELYDLLAVSDALLSDVSSVVIDYLATERPIGLVGFDAGAYTRDLVIPYASLLASRRLDDLSDPRALGPFFEGVAAGTVRARAQDDVGPWLHAAPSGEGCTTVLAAVGLG
jgi:CDP-glycerol glycerophosphotransferase (TagB/SpsB family)